MASSSILFILLLLFLSFVPLNSSSSGIIQLELTHLDADADGLTNDELIRRGVQRSQRRISTLQAKQSRQASATLDAPLYAGQGEFYTTIAIGTPEPLQFSAIVDTGSDLTWTQCEPCYECFKQTTPIFDPSKSSSYHEVSCSSNQCQELPRHHCNQSSCRYMYIYEDMSFTGGVLATETFTLDGTVVPSIAFGCGNDNSAQGFPPDSAGLVGLGRGPLSLISQIGSQKFSYCLTSFGSSKKSSMLLGSLPDLGSGKLVSTPIIKDSSFYYLNLNGITVGETLLDIPNSTFAMNPADRSGGLIIDSGTYLTYLVEAAYKVVAEAFQNQTKLNQRASPSNLQLNLCFDMPPSSTLESLDLPGLIFHFEGADLDLPVENYFIVDSSSHALCLMMERSDGMSIFGNFQQQNMQVLYNMEENILTFSPFKCG